MRKVCTLVLSVVIGLWMLTGCGMNSSESIVFSVGTGDKISVTLNTSDGLHLKQTDAGYSIVKEDVEISQAFFVERAVYEQYIDAVSNEDGVVVNEESTKNGLTYLFYSYNGEAGQENNFIVWIDGTDTGVIIASLADMETAQTAFEKTSFSEE